MTLIRVDSAEEGGMRRGRGLKDEAEGGERGGKGTAVMLAGSSSVLGGT